jgi:hypothetical protein
MFESVLAQTHLRGHPEFVGATDNPALDEGDTVLGRQIGGGQQSGRAAADDEDIEIRFGQKGLGIMP